VYEYTLTEENGLIFQIENNVGTVRSGTEPTKAALEDIRENYSGISRVHGNAGTLRSDTITSNVTLKDVQKGSLLWSCIGWAVAYLVLCLRGLRNAIMTAPAVAPTATEENQPSKSPEKQLSISEKLPYTTSANQLQYVNKQLSAETKGLGIRFNDITLALDITNDAKTLTLLEIIRKNQAGRNAVRFLSKLPAPEFRYLRVITIRCHPEYNGSYPLTYREGREILHWLARFFQVNRHVTIRFCIPAMNGYHLIVIACQLKLVYRGDRAFMEKYLRHPRHCEEIESVAWRQHWELRGRPFRKFPENLRIVVEKEGWNEKIFRKGCMSKRSIRDHTLPRVEGGLETWVQLAQEFMEKGI
jgi:hypothetical protein